jgi:hypothetical protein
MTDPTQNDLLNVPTQVTVSDVTDTEIDFRASEKQKVLGQKDAGWFSTFWAAHTAHVPDFWGMLLGWIVGAWDTWMSWGARIFDAANSPENTGQWELAGAILEGLLQMPIDTDKLRTTAIKRGQHSAAENLGADFFNALLATIAPTGDISADQGLANAAGMMGYLLNFGIREGNVAMVADIEIEGTKFFQGLEGYTEGMSKALGLSRLARIVLHPLVQITAGDPVTYALRKKYRPTLHDAKDLAAAYFRGDISDADMAEQLAIEGWTDQRGKEHIDALRPRVLSGEIFRAYDSGAIDRPEALRRLGLLGYVAADAEFLTKVHDTEVAQKSSQRIANKLGEEFLRGVITETEFTAALGNLSLSDTERTAIIGETGQLSVLPRHSLTILEMHKAFLDGVITVTDWDQYLVRTGYRQDDRAILTNTLLLDAAKQKATGTAHVAPRLSWAQLKAAVKGGILTVDEVKDHLTAHGYTAADIATLLAELPAPPPPPTPPAA